MEVVGDIHTVSSSVLGLNLLLCAESNLCPLLYSHKSTGQQVLITVDLMDEHVLLHIHRHRRYTV